MLLTIFKIIFGALLVLQVYWLFYWGKKRGRQSTGKKAHQDYEKHQSGELHLDNLCGGIWYQTSKEQYDKYVGRNGMNQGFIFLTLMINIALHFADLSGWY